MIALQTYNRTILELKRQYGGVLWSLRLLIIAPFWNWNKCTRLRMSRPTNLIIAPFWNWNGIVTNTYVDGIPLIIAPFWNWNLIREMINYQCQQAYNRTILELKHCWRFSLPYFAHTYNRTILELKQTYRKMSPTPGILIIAPFWNWNFHPSNLFVDVLNLIIAPFWNWNSFRTVVIFTILLLIIAPFWNWNAHLLFCFVSRLIL